MSYPSRSFGIISDLSGTIAQGIIANNVSYTDSVQTAEAQGLSGEVIDIAGYSKKRDVSVDGLFVGTGVTVGKKITINGQDYLVSQATKTEACSDFVKTSITANGADNAVIWEM